MIFEGALKAVAVADNLDLTACLPAPHGTFTAIKKPTPVVGFFSPQQGVAHFQPNPIRVYGIGK